MTSARTALRLARALTFTALAAIGALACSSHQAALVADRHAALGGETVALVGAVPIPASIVGQVAGAREITPPQALALVIDDELAAQEASRLGLASSADVEWPITSALARATAMRIRTSMLAAGDPTDDEVAERTAAHWRELLRPPSIHVVHALVFRPRDPKPGDLERAHAVAVAMLHAVSGATSTEDFEARANAVPHAGVRIKVERLPAFIVDGRNAEGAMATNQPEFTRAAFALTTPGQQTSSLVETQKFGWHVIRLIDQVPAHEVPLAERRTLLHDEILDKRGDDATLAVLTAQSASIKIEIAPAAEALMKSISPTSAP